MLNNILSLDLWINQNISLLQNPALTKIMIFISGITNNTILAILVIILLLILIYQNKKNKIILLIASLILGFGSELLLKYLIHRARPENALTEISSYSFPSGHALKAMIFFAIIIFSFKDDIKNNILKYLFIGLNIFLILLIGFSRIYLSVHWFTDVIAGFLLGLFWIILLIKTIPKLSINKIYK